MVTFNEMLRAYGIDPATVTLLRHTGAKGPLGLSPYDLWTKNDGSFDRYQSTQASDKALFGSSVWATFVSTPENETLFVGLYAAAKGDRSEIIWNCPMTGLPPGQDKRQTSDLYHLTLLDTLAEHRGSLKIEWDNGWIAWARYARKSNHMVLGPIDIQPIADFDGSAEGAATWQMQRIVERDSRLAKDALIMNGDKHNGLYACDACYFQHSDRAMFDAHHPRPLLAGPRITRASELIVLCPVCHRRAHRSPNRMLPFTLAELRAWNESGRP